MTDDEQRRHTGHHLSRRAFLGASTTAAVALAGCLEGSDDPRDGGDGSASDGGAAGTAPSRPGVANPPEAVYLPSHQEPMQMVPPVEAGDYRVSLMLSFPHRFWLITGTEREEVSVDSGDVHLMATVQDTETGTVVPVDTGAQFRVTQAGNLVDRRAPWPMISQRMGFHFGDNVELSGYGTYSVEFDVTPLTGVKRTRGFEGRFEQRETVAFEFTFDEETERELVTDVTFFEEDQWGKRDAIPPMGTDDSGTSMPYSQLPAASTYPGRAVGTPSSGDAAFVVRYLEDDELAGGERGYLLVSPRTPYNRVPLPDMALSVTGAVEGELTQTLDSELGHHYGIPAALSPGAELEIRIETPPQVARHRGYDTAFLDMPPLEVRVPE
ncbi:MAG: iron transporter [Halovenus sp.]